LSDNKIEHGHPLGTKLRKEDWDGGHNSNGYDGGRGDNAAAADAPPFVLPRGQPLAPSDLHPDKLTLWGRLDLDVIIHLHSNKEECDIDKRTPLAPGVAMVEDDEVSGVMELRYYSSSGSGGLGGSRSVLGGGTIFGGLLGFGGIGGQVIQSGGIRRLPWEGAAVFRP